MQHHWMLPLSLNVQARPLWHGDMDYMNEFMHEAELLSLRQLVLHAFVLWCCRHRLLVMSVAGGRCMELRFRNGTTICESCPSYGTSATGQHMLLDTSACHNRSEYRAIDVAMII